MPRITSKELFAWSSYLGNILGDNFPILQQTACMNLSNRELYGYIEILKLLDPEITTEDEKDLIQQLIRREEAIKHLPQKVREKIKFDPLKEMEYLKIQKIAQILGWVAWEKDTISDMALRIGTKTKFHSILHDSEMLTIEVPEDWDKYLPKRKEKDGSTANSRSK